ncbi:MAG: SDR family NAD(P)-dependent oxidoreductase [Caenibius sp.]
MAELRFDGQVALVTGSGSGIGRNHAIELARRGAHVMVNDIALTSDGTPVAQIVAEELKAEGLSADFSRANVAVEDEARGMVEATVTRFGRIDLLVNNAGNTDGKTIEELTTLELRNILDVHLFGSFWCLQQALGHMRKQNFGRIVNTSSALGLFGSSDYAAYMMAKSALLGLTRATAFGNTDKDILTNSLAPVAMTPLSEPYFKANLPHIDSDRLGAGNVTPAVLYLLSRDCQLNGEIISVGGGRMARVFIATSPGYRPGDLQAENIAANLDTVLSTEGFEILKMSVDQYRFL